MSKSLADKHDREILNQIELWFIQRIGFALVLGTFVLSVIRFTGAVQW